MGFLQCQKILKQNWLAKLKRNMPKFEYLLIYIWLTASIPNLLYFAKSYFMHFTKEA